MTTPQKFSTLVVFLIILAFFTLKFEVGDVFSETSTQENINNENTITKKQEETTNNSDSHEPPSEPDIKPTDTINVGNNPTKDNFIKTVVTNPEDILILVNKEWILTEDFVPSDLIIPDIPFSFEGDSPKKLMRKEAALALEKLVKKAQEDNIILKGVSGYRSYHTQAAIFANNVKKRGEEEANKFSARPGESEHQTGLAMDISAPSVNYQLSNKLGDMPEGKWLMENAPQFGFIIRYLSDKTHITGYIYEPWHLRYVGQAIAIELSEKNLTLEEYLGR